MKKLLSLFLTAFLILSALIPFSVTAAQNDPSFSSQPEASFIATTPEQYDELVSMLSNGSAEDKQFAVDYIFDLYNGNISTYAWDFQYSVKMDDGTNRNYGFVAYSDSFAGLSIRTVVPAVLRGTPQYGYTWESYDSSAATSLAGSGAFTYEGSVTVSIVTTQQLYIATAGNYTISKTNAISLGVDLQLFEYSHTVGSTMYYRHYKTGSHIEYSPVRQG